MKGACLWGFFLLLHALPVVSYIAGVHHVYIGCFNNVENIGTGMTSDLMSPFWCISRCEQNNTGFMLLQHNNTCYCTNRPRSAVPTDERSCNSPCLGDRNQMCGGGSSYSLYARSTMPGVATLPDDDAVWHTLIVNDSATTFTISPGRRGGHSAILTPRGGMFVFGGYTVWEVSMHNISANTSQSGDESNNSTNTEEQISFVYTFTGNITHFNNVWRFDINTFSWFRHHNGIGTCPSPRSSHSAVWTQLGGDRGMMVVFGGFTGPGEDPRPVNDVWSYNIDLKEWFPWPSYGIESGVPVPRGGHSAIMLKTNTTMIIFGGSSATKYLRDVWSYSFVSHDWELLSDGTDRDEPPPRSRHAAVMSPTGTMIVTFGRGRNHACITDFQDTWEFDLGTKHWRLLSDGSTPWDHANHRWASPVPPVRYGHAAVVTDSRTMLILGGGRNSKMLFDVWAFDLETYGWKQVQQPLVRPSTRSGFSAIAFPDGIVIFGGEFDSDLYFNDVWRLQLLPGVDLTTRPGDSRSEWAVGVGLASYWLLLALLYVVTMKRHKRLPSVAKVPRLPWKRKTAEEQEMELPLVTLEDAPLKGREHLLDEVEIVMELERPRMHIIHQHSHFDQLSDKILLQIFGYLHGQEVARVSQVSRRFHKMIQKQSYWKDMVLQEWNWRWVSANIISIDSEASLMASADRQVDYFGLYLKHHGRLRKSSFIGVLYSILTFVRTCYPLYVLMLLATLQIYLIGLKVDDYILLPWRSVLFPSWIVQGALVLLGILLAAVYARSSPFDWPVRRLYPFLKSKSATITVALAIAMMILGTVFVSLKLDAGTPFAAERSWWFVGFPFYVLLAILTVHHAVGAVCGGVTWSWGAFWLGFTFLGYLISWLMVIAKIESDSFSQSMDWWTVFMPWWVSDAFALAAVVFVCQSFASSKLIWTSLAVYIGYLVCICTFQGLLNTNLEPACGDNPVSYSYTLIFIPLYVLVAVVGVLGVTMLSHRSWIARVDSAYSKVVTRFGGA